MACRVGAHLRPDVVRALCQPYVFVHRRGDAGKAASVHMVCREAGGVYHRVAGSRQPVAGIAARAAKVVDMVAGGQGCRSSAVA